MLPHLSPIRPLDIPFERVPVATQTPDGRPYVRWVTMGMPNLGEYSYLLDIVFFLYPDTESARQGRGAGGTGFFVGIPSVTYPQRYHHIYAVTNWHVAVNQGHSVIRVNTTPGSSPAIFAFEPHEWRFIPGHHDVAVIPFHSGASDLKMHAIDAKSFFLTDDDIITLGINAAEDVFMLGRFIDYDGVEANCPSMRFGNISMMEAFVKPRTGFAGSSIVVDMHSRTGYSGSPVFVYQTVGSFFLKGQGFLSGAGHTMKLLGILWAQFPETWDIEDKPAVSETAEQVNMEGKAIRGWSGMSLVAPAATIWDVLHTKELVDLRAAIDSLLHKEFAGSPIEQQ